MFILYEHLKLFNLFFENWIKRHQKKKQTQDIQIVITYVIASVVLLTTNLEGFKTQAVLGNEGEMEGAYLCT